VADSRHLPVEWCGFPQQRDLSLDFLCARALIRSAGLWHEIRKKSKEIIVNTKIEEPTLALPFATAEEVDLDPNLVPHISHGGLSVIGVSSSENR
jgi:hypothetical protein